MTNNDILKKLRVALQYRDDDIQRIIKHAGMEVSKSELGALFRNPDHPKFKPCGDQLLRNFLNGLVIEKRGPQEAKKTPSRKSSAPYSSKSNSSRKKPFNQRVKKK